MTTLAPPLLFLFLPFLAANQTHPNLLAGPYLQDAAPHQIHVLWETANSEVCQIHWHVEGKPWNTEPPAEVWVNKGTSRIHRVMLDSLAPATRYSYQITGENWTSEVFHFTTPALASEERSFSSWPSATPSTIGHAEKFREIVEEGDPFLKQGSESANPLERLTWCCVPAIWFETGPPMPTGPAIFPAGSLPSSLRPVLPGSGQP
ncbi:MAG: fibronectin type III domain-containing protein [Bacteroidales bacterium]